MNVCPGQVWGREGTGMVLVLRHHGYAWLVLSLSHGKTKPWFSDSVGDPRHRWVRLT